MNNQKLILAGAALFTLGACSLPQQSAEDSPWGDYRNWQHVTSEEASTGDPTGFVGNVHMGREGYREVYANDVAQAIIMGSAPYNYPVGSIIVKEQYKNKAAWQSRKSPDLTVAVKVSEGEGVDTWTWATGYGKAEKNAFCSGCHTIAAKDDFIFTHADFLSGQ